MTLFDMAAAYRAEARRQRAIMARLRAQRKAARSAAERAEIVHLIAIHGAIQTQCYDLAELCERYYDRAYYRNPKYTFND